MAKRWAPILGMTGFDGGTKPAISIASYKIRIKQPEPVISPTPPAGECPCIRVTFNDVGFCGCQDLASGSVEYSDVNLNGGTFEMFRPDPSDEGACSDCSFQIPFIPTFPKVHRKQWDANSCSGSLIVDEDAIVFIYIMRIGTTWGIIVADLGGTTQRMIFYAETTDISGPIDNQLDCEGFPYTLPETPFTTCMLNISNPTFRMAVTSGGTITITPQTDDCGDCCQDGTGSDCSEGTLAHCEDYSGTFHSGEHCVVDPVDGSLTCP